MTDITRHYAFSNDRQIHYRVAGSGPPVIMFHQSPRSSAEFEPIIRDWARRFTVIAPDTPGNGHSDPLPEEQPDMFDFAHAMAGFMDAIGLQKTCVFGYHTGSAVAMALAKLYPARVACVALNGFAILTQQEKDAFLSAYLPKYVPDWSGQHLTWLWARYREQVIFFPWFAASNETRMPYDMSDMDKMHAQIMDHIWAGDAYRHAYHAAFAFDKNPIMNALEMPVTIMAAPPDPLVAHLDRLAELPANVVVERPKDAAALHARAFEIFSDIALDDFQLKPAAAPAGKLLRTYAGTANNIHMRAATASAAQSPENKGVVLLLHDILQNSACLEADAKALIEAGYELCVPDLPAHGLSDELADESEITDIDNSSTQYAEKLASAIAPHLAASNKHISHIVTYGMSDVIGHALQTNLASAQTNPPKLICVACLHPATDDKELLADWVPDLTPNFYGGHLLVAWYVARGQSLFWPAHNEKKESIIPIDENLAPEAVEVRFKALMEARPPAFAYARQMIDKGSAGAEALEKTLRQAHILLPAWAKTIPNAAPMPAGAHIEHYEGGSLAARHKAVLAALQK